MTNKFKKEWIQQGLTATEGLDFLDKFGLELCDKKDTNDRPGFDAMTTSQVRNIFTEIKRLQAKVDKERWDKSIDIEFNLLRPKVAYSAARELSKRKSSKIKYFREVFDRAHNAVTESKEEDRPKAFKHFCQFFEAVIAYHKVHGGKD